VTSSTTTTPSKTSQAFAEACRVYIAKFDSWIAELEMMFVRGPNPGAKQICTPLSLRLETDERFGIMLDCLSASLSCADDDTPNRLLNALYSILENTATHRAELLQIFIASAAPLWGMLGDWLVRGMPIPRSLIDFDSQSEDERNLDAEFWIKRDQDISWADEDFWESAFLLPQPNDDGGEEDGRPSWIEREILELVLEAGKARGLLRGLLGRDADDAGGQEPWVPLETVLSGSLASSTDRSSVDLVDSVSSYLRPICQLTTVQLRRTLDEDCGLQAHLDAIDGLFYMRGYSVLQPWNEWLFSQVHPKSFVDGWHWLTTIGDIT
jgi:gamma-tubulin complex component 5